MSQGVSGWSALIGMGGRDPSEYTKGVVYSTAPFFTFQVKDPKGHELSESVPRHAVDLGLQGSQSLAQGNILLLEFGILSLELSGSILNDLIQPL